MKHKNPAPQTRVMGIIVWCHNIHFRRLTKHHWGYHLAHWGRSSAPQGGNLQGTGCHPPPCHPHTPPRLQLTPLPSPAHHVPAAAGENWLSPGASHDGGPSSTVLLRPAQLAGWTGCSNEGVSPQTRGFTLKLSRLQSHHEEPHFSLQVGWELAGSLSSPCVWGAAFPCSPHLRLVPPTSASCQPQCFQRPGNYSS